MHVYVYKLQCNPCLLACFLDPLNPPNFTVMCTISTSRVMCSIDSMNMEMRPLIVGYEVIRFGVPMIGEYTSKGGTVTICSAVPGAQYRIIAWALGNDNRSATPAVESVEAKENSKLTKLMH